MNINEEEKNKCFDVENIASLNAKRIAVKIIQKYAFI